MITNIQKILAQEINAFDELFSKSFHSKIPLLNVVLSYLIKSKGKGYRSLFVILWAKIMGECKEKTYRAATLVELLHTATLVHDDVVDDAQYRRGVFSIKTLWKNKVSVLTGDYLLAKGLLIALDNNDFAILKILSQAVKQMSEGELEQLEKSRFGLYSETEYYSIIRKKTASLLASACACGVASVSPDEKAIKLAYNFGENLGLAFQIKDDLLDFAECTGKTKGNDLKQKKNTLPIIYILNILKGYEKDEFIYLLKIVAKKNNIVPEIIKIINKYKGFEYATIQMNKYLQTALNFLESFEESLFKKALYDLSLSITNRTK